MARFENLDRVWHLGKVRYVVGRRPPNLQKREKEHRYDLSDHPGNPRPIYREVPEHLLKAYIPEDNEIIEAVREAKRLRLAVNNQVSKQNKLAGESVL